MEPPPPPPGIGLLKVISDKKPGADPEVSQMGHLISTLLFSEN